MEDLAKSAHELETHIITAINDSHLPAAFVEYIMRNILMQIQSLEQAPAETAEPPKEG